MPGPSVFPSREPGVSGGFWGSQEGCQGPSRPSGRNRGLPLRRRGGQGPPLAKRWEPRGFSRVAAGFSSYNGDLSLPLGWPWEAQSSPRVAREIWGLRSSHCRAEETSPRRVSRTYYSSPGKAGISGLHSRLPRGVRPRLEGKPRTPLSSRVATRICWSPLSGLNGVQPALQFGERTRDWSPGHAGI